MLTKEDVKPAQKKIKAVLDLQTPTTLKNIGVHYAWYSSIGICESVEAIHCPAY